MRQSFRKEDKIMLKFEENFFQKEVRCDFEISEMMKRAWAAAFEVFDVVVTICERHHLTYFCDGGTLLGAVRHQGFIPWDDDIDICLKREDYNKLIKVLPVELPDGFVVAGMYAECKRLQDAAKISNLRVIADETKWSFNDYMKRFHGFPYQRIGIDIFPLDYISRDQGMVLLQKEILAFGFYTLQNWDKYCTNGELEQRIQYIETLCNKKLPRDASLQNKMWRLLDTVSSLTYQEEADDIADFFYYLENDAYRVKKDCYKEAISMSFEGYQVNIPVGYHEILCGEYGDYMQMVKNTAEHSYPFYGHMEKELEKQIRAVGFEGTVDEFCRLVSSGELQV